MSARAIRAEGVLEAIMNAVILYDDNGMAAQARAMLNRAGRRADEAMLWDVKLWRCDMLRWPATADLALEDAQAAQLIVLALRNPTALPAGMLDWLEQWASGQHVPEAALAVFDESRGDLLASPPEQALSQFTERYGLCFIDESASFLEDLHQREVAQTPTLLHILEQGCGDVHQR
jgi:hypothetical protein